MSSLEPKAALARLRESKLLKTQGIIGGKWIDAYDGKTIQVLFAFLIFSTDCSDVCLLFDEMP